MTVMNTDRSLGSIFYFGKDLYLTRLSLDS